MKSEEKDYRDWLEEHGGALTSDQYASHQHLLEEVIPLLQALDRFMRRHDVTGSFASGAVLTKDQRDTLSRTYWILKRLQYPAALLSVRPPKPMLKLPKRGS